MKIYLIEADMNGFVQARDALGKEIGALSLKQNEVVYFHDYKDPVCGAPVILLECSEMFIETVRKLSGCKKSTRLSTELATERSPRIWSYFTGVPLKPDVKRNGPKL